MFSNTFTVLSLVVLIAQFLLQSIAFNLALNVNVDTRRHRTSMMLGLKLANRFLLNPPKNFAKRNTVLYQIQEIFLLNAENYLLHLKNNTDIWTGKKIFYYSSDTDYGGHIAAEKFKFICRPSESSQAVEYFSFRKESRQGSKARYDKMHNNLVAIPGSPGIGKSTFLIHFQSHRDQNTTIT